MPLQARAFYEIILNMNLIRKVKLPNGVRAFHFSQVEVTPEFARQSLESAVQMPGEYFDAQESVIDRELGRSEPTEPFEIAAARIPQPWGEGRFLWATHRHEEIVSPREMATPHLFYALRMLFNNSVPPAFRIGDFKRYRDVRAWDPRYKQQAMNALAEELAKRDDLEQDLVDQVNDMVFNTKALCALGLLFPVFKFPLPPPIMPEPTRRKKVKVRRRKAKRKKAKAKRKKIKKKAQPRKQPRKKRKRK